MYLVASNDTTSLLLFVEYSESVVQFLPALYQNLLGEDIRKRVDPENTHRFEELIVSWGNLFG